MCEYCDGKEKELPQENEDIIVDINNNILGVYCTMGNKWENFSGSTEIQINYCPMCGNKL